MEIQTEYDLFNILDFFRLSFEGREERIHRGFS